MKKSIVLAVAAALVVGATASEAQEDFRLSGSEVAVYNLAGHVELVRGSGSDVVVHVTRGGDDASRLEIEVGEVRGREALRVIYPGDEVQVQGPEIMAPFGEIVSEEREAKIIRASRLEQLWTRLTGDFEVMELCEFSFSEDARL